MANRKGGKGTAEAEPAAETTEDTTVTETPTDAVPDGPADADTDSKPDVDLDAALVDFRAAVDTAITSRDESTGVVPEANQAAVNSAYSALDGAKLKAAAKREVNESMKSAMNDGDIVLARSYMNLNQDLAATKGKKNKTRTPREPVDPTEAFVERVGVLNLAYNLAGDVVPEGVAEDWLDQVGKALEGVDMDSAAAYRTWLLDESEEKGDAPEATPLVVAAVKLSLGRSAKPGKAPKKQRVTEGPVYDGPRRDVAKHIQEAFADKEPGTFMKVSQIRKFVSSEYSDPADPPSAGAISIRLFPKAGACTIEGIEPDTDGQGNKGARKAG